MADQNEIHSAIDALIASFGVTVVITPMGERPKAMGGDLPMDQWLCVFNAPRHSEHFDFFTGMGHRNYETMICRQYRRDYGARALRMSGYTKAATIVAPHAASVLHSLILDSSAADQTFSQWCREYGYDTDSHTDSRKALATYEACQQGADKMRRIFTREQIEQIGSALQDY